MLAFKTGYVKKLKMLQVLIEIHSARNLPNTTLTQNLMWQEFIPYMKMFLMKMKFLSSFANDTCHSQVTESERTSLSSVSKDNTVITLNKEHQLNLKEAKKEYLYMTLFPKEESRINNASRHRKIKILRACQRQEKLKTKEVKG